MIKVISGGQTGVDRGALDAALKVGFPIGGFIPKNRQAEDGQVPAHYNLNPHKLNGYAGRTVANVQLSDATVHLHRGVWGRGTELTKRYCRWFNKPFLSVSLYEAWKAPDVGKHLALLDELEDLLRVFDVVNFAGTRESKDPGVQENVTNFLIPIFERIKSEA